MTKKEILGLTLEQMQDEFLALGLKKFRAEQVFRWIYEKGATTFEEMTNLSKENRSLLEGTYSILSGAVKVLRTYDSADRLTHKVLLGLSDGASVETVLMHHDYGYSACLSSQVGCAMNCTFCGEPMLNLDNVLAALDLMHHDKGQCISYRNMTISTCGIVPGIEEMTRQGRTINLAVSLHAATGALRDRLMPINGKYPFPEVIDAASRYEKMNGRQVMYEYILLAGINDREEDARALAEALSGKECVVNLIPANPVPEKGFRRPEDRDVDRFFQYLKKRHINVTVRKEMGKDINAACGQLRASQLKEEQA